MRDFNIDEIVVVTSKYDDRVEVCNDWVEIIDFIQSNVEWEEIKEYYKDYYTKTILSMDGRYYKTINVLSALDNEDIDEFTASIYQSYVTSVYSNVVRELKKNRKASALGFNFKIVKVKKIKVKR